MSNCYKTPFLQRHNNQMVEFDDDPKNEDNFLIWNSNQKSLAMRKQKQKMKRVVGFLYSHAAYFNFELNDINFWLFAIRKVEIHLSGPKWCELTRIWRKKKWKKSYVSHYEIDARENLWNFLLNSRNECDAKKQLKIEHFQSKSFESFWTDFTADENRRKKLEWVE